MKDAAKSTLLEVLDAIASACAMHIVVDRGHKHSQTNISEAAFWLESLPPSDSEKEGNDDDGDDHESERNHDRRSIDRDPWENGNDLWSQSHDGNGDQHNAKSGARDCQRDGCRSASKEPRTHWDANQTQERLGDLQERMDRLETLLFLTDVLQPELEPSPKEYSDTESNIVYRCFTKVS